MPRNEGTLSFWLDPSSLSEATAAGALQLVVRTPLLMSNVFDRVNVIPTRARSLEQEGLEYAKLALVTRFELQRVVRPDAGKR